MVYNTISPEIVESKEYDKKADIWASGCILYEMASLQPPFYATNMLSLAKKVMMIILCGSDNKKYIDC